MSQIDAPQPAATHPVEPKKASPIRLIVLLGILAIVLAGFLVDLFWMYDSVKAASDRLQESADAMAHQPNEKGRPQFLSRDGVVEAIGFQPTNSRVEDGRLIEQYRWWGPLPLQRRFIEVFYSDPDGNAYDKYEISNRNIFGNDIDPEELNIEEQHAAPLDPNATPSAPLPDPSMPGPVVTPPGGEPNGESEPSEEKSPSTSTDTGIKSPDEVPPNDGSTNE